MNRALVFILFVLVHTYAGAQPMATLAERIRKTSHIPELAYAVIAADSVLDMQVLGVRKINTSLQARMADRFRIGSNTKAVTGMLAAMLVKRGLLSWNTRFFDLVPELKAGSRKEYYDYTLQDLLSFRTRLIKYTYTDELPRKEQLKGDEAQQRYEFLKWVLQQPPVAVNGGISFSNPDYVAAALMLERATNKTYKEMVLELGRELGINFGFGQPNAKDNTQTWGHNGALEPEAPVDNYKLNWLLPAGNINLTLPDYIKFLQLQLKGLQGRSSLLTRAQFEFMHYGARQFAIGWFWEKDKKGRLVSSSTGNPGTFLAKVYVIPKADRAFIILSNAQTDDADRGMDELYAALMKKYL